MTNAGQRSKYVVDGRRVRLGDLIEAGLLTAGDVLVFNRPRLDESYLAKVTIDGMLALEDGSVHEAPSRAAAEAAGMDAVDGWSAWVVEQSGTSLFDLRSKMLAQSDEDDGIHERLSQVADGTEIKVRDLLDWWGAKGRGRRVANRIAADLANHDLISVPDFEKVTLDATVVLKRRSRDVEETPAAVGLAEDLDEQDEHELGLTIGNLPTAFSELTSVKPTDAVNVATSHMKLNDYWQLPVVDKNGRFYGAVTWESLAVGSLQGNAVSVSDVLVDAQMHPFDSELIDVLPSLVDNGFILVTGADQEMAGIITMSDVVEAYGDLASPFIVVGETDHLLRRILQSIASLEDVQSAVGSDTRKIKSFDDLTFGDYKSMLGQPTLWDKLPTLLDRKVFGRRLDEVREIRNSLAHFEPDPLEDGDLQKLRLFLDVVRDIASEI